MMRCANCDKEIEGSYFKCLDNYIQWNYFEESDQSDNIFCSQECFCESLSLEEVDVEKDEPSESDEDEDDDDE